MVSAIVRLSWTDCKLIHVTNIISQHGSGIMTVAAESFRSAREPWCEPRNGHRKRAELAQSRYLGRKRQLFIHGRCLPRRSTPLGAGRRRIAGDGEPGLHRATVAVTHINRYELHRVSSLNQINSYLFNGDISFRFNDTKHWRCRGRTTPVVPAHSGVSVRRVLERSSPKNRSEPQFLGRSLSVSVLTSS